jgi:hypothetical protein
LISLKEEIVAEFPASGNEISLDFNNNRGYTSLRDDCWIDLTKNEKVKKLRKQKKNTRSV